MKNYLLVFDSGAELVIDAEKFLEHLDEHAQLYAIDGHSFFIKSVHDAAFLTDKFLPFAGSSLFFITAIGAADFSGRMVGRFWEFLKDDAAVATAA